jgi:hypothetical protein
MRVTRVEAATAVCAMALVAAGIGFFTRSASAVTDREMGTEDAKRVLRAAEAWMGEHGATGCPTLTRLQEDGHLSREARTDDPWGARFRVVCQAEGTVVKSPGQDGQMRTEDDLVVSSAAGT